MKKYLIFIFLYPYVSIGSNNIDEVKFEIIQETLKFLATDDSTSNKIDWEADCKVLDYDCLKRNCEEGAISGAIPKMYEWRKITIKNVNELNDFYNFILKEITDSRSYRKEFDNYKEFIDNVKVIIKKYNDDSINELPTNDRSDGAEIGVVKDGTSVNSESNKSQNSLTILALIFGFIGTTLSIYLIYKNKRIKEINAMLISVDSKMANFIDELINLKKINQSTFVNENYSLLNDRISNLELKILDSKNRQIEFEVGNQIKHNKIEEDIRGTQLRYAKIPDLPNGFSDSIFVKDQDGEQIFEIIIDDNVAEFKVTSDLSAQKYALSDFNYYLSTACTFINQPLKGSKIETAKSGILRKDGNKWILEQKAQVEFIL